MKTLYLILVICSAATINAEEKTGTVRYVAIGDSYSIGEGASPDQSWPAVLTRHLKAQGLPIDLVANPSVTGWTSQQAIDHELPLSRLSVSVEITNPKAYPAALKA